MVSDLEEAGIKPHISHPKSINELRNMITSHGSAIVSIDNGSGGYVIIVDEISPFTEKIRDSFHGWSITIPLHSLTCSLENFKSPIIQLQKSQPFLPLSR